MCAPFASFVRRLDGADRFFLQPTNRDGQDRPSYGPESRARFAFFALFPASAEQEVSAGRRKEDRILSVPSQYIQNFALKRLRVRSARLCGQTGLANCLPSLNSLLPSRAHSSSMLALGRPYAPTLETVQPRSPCPGSGFEIDLRKLTSTDDGRRWACDSIACVCATRAPMRVWHSDHLHLPAAVSVFQSNQTAKQSLIAHKCFLASPQNH